MLFRSVFLFVLARILLSNLPQYFLDWLTLYSRDTSQVRFVNLSNRTVKNARKNSPGPITVDTSPMLVDKSTQLFKLTDRSDKASQEVINDWFWRAKWPVLRRFCAKYARTSFDLCCSIYVRDKGVSLD